MQDATPRRSSNKRQSGIGRRYEDLEAVLFGRIEKGQLNVRSRARQEHYG